MNTKKIMGRNAILNVDGLLMTVRYFYNGELKFHTLSLRAVLDVILESGTDSIRIKENQYPNELVNSITYSDKSYNSIQDLGVRFGTEDVNYLIGLAISKGLSGSTIENDHINLKHNREYVHNKCSWWYIIGIETVELNTNDFNEFICISTIEEDNNIQLELF